jgi:hypothetical protein
MEAIRFWWEAVKLAFRHSSSMAQEFLFVAILVAGVAGYFVPMLLGIESLMSGWQAAAMVLGTIFMVRLLLAPYWLYQQKPGTAAAGDIGVPNMTIREVFFHIDPDILENDTDNRLERVSKDIRDKLSTKHALSWGRLINRQKKSRSALVKIPNDYWATAQFTYDFLSQGSEDQGHSWHPHEGGLSYEYADLRMNRARVETLWPVHEIDAKRRRAAFRDIRQEYAKAINRLLSVGNRLSEALRLHGYNDQRQREFEDWIETCRAFIRGRLPNFETLFDDMSAGGAGPLLDVMVDMQDSVPWHKSSKDEIARIKLIDLVGRRCNNLQRIYEHLLHFKSPDGEGNLM